MGKKETALGTVASKEITASHHIPYTCHVDPHTVRTESGDYVQVVKLQGISYQTTDNDMLNQLHKQRNIMLRSIARGTLAIWTTIIREEAGRYPVGNFEKGSFADQLNEKYKQKQGNRKLYKNDLYISVVLRDVGNLKIITGAKKLKKTIVKTTDKQKTLNAIKQITDTTNTIISNLGKYEPRRLGIYNHKGVFCSEIVEFFGRIINGKYRRFPITRKNIRNILSVDRLSFGTETGECRMINDCSYFGSLGIKEYCPNTNPGMLDNLLTQEMEFVLTQSFACTNKQDAIKDIKLQRDRLIAAGDLSETQIDELTDALDDLVSNRVVAGFHHFNLIVYAPTIRKLEENLADASTPLQEALLIVSREDLGLEASFWAQLPGNFSYRPRPALITSRNFSGFSPFHNFPSGHISGNHWGPATAMFPTISRTPYYFSFHNRASSGQPPGNGAVVGPTGVGKTVVMGFMLAMAEKYGGRRIFFDKDMGAAIMVQAAGGIYSALKKGVPTGLNPLQLEPSPSNIEFLQKLFSRIALFGGPLENRDEKEISDAISGVLGLPKHQRKLSNMLPFMDLTRQNGPAKRLMRWAGEGDRAWVFDNDEDRLRLDANYLGFDMTEVLDDDDLRTPIALYIIHRIKSLIDGTRIIINFDEGWKYARDEILGADLENFYRTIRKQEGIVIFGTNDPGDVSKSEIGRVIMQQSQWQILFPNPKARRVEYIEGMDLTEKEFNIIRNLPDRSFLIKRGISSTVVQLDLAGMEDELAVLSGSTKNVNLLNGIIAETGQNPNDFLPIFQKRRKEAA